MGFNPSVEIWRPAIEKAAGDLPVEFLLAWIQRESDGNPCSYTSMHESGIFQLMPPDNTNVAGTTEAALRTACVGSSMRLDHALTSDEVNEQVRSGIQFVTYARQYAHDQLNAVGADWPETSADFWRMVKMVHVSPVAVRRLADAAQHYGRAPQSWDEYAQVAANYVPQGWIDNAEWVGSFGEGGGSKLRGFFASDWGKIAIGIGIAATLWYGAKYAKKHGYSIPVLGLVA